MEKRTERQLEIIEAAGKILTEQGVHGLTTKKLAQKVGFSESAIYRHFKSKEDIIVSLLTYLSESMDERFSQLSLNDKNPIESFEILFMNQFQFFTKQPHFVVAVFSDGLMEASDRINQTIARIMQVKMKHLMPIIIDGQQKDLFTNTITAEELLNIVMGTFRLQMYKWRQANFEFDIERQGKNMIASVLTLIKTKNEQ
jgi:TetR/AcrR family fatty acid metabolism transcriptional regulator